MADAPKIVTMNRGSSSLKGAIYNAGEHLELLVRMKLQKSGEQGGSLEIEDAAGKSVLCEKIADVESESALQRVFGFLGEKKYLEGLVGAGHRLVHGGEKYRQPVKLSAEVIRDLENLIPIDPDHLSAALQGIRFVAKTFPELPQVACFDTAFHADLPAVARSYAIPRELSEKGIVRYGFHGLSYEFLMEELRRLEGDAANGRVILAHLGGGASMSAVLGGKSIDTSMGFTPLEGLVMGTRSGDIDGGALLYLMEHGATEPGSTVAGKKYSAKELGYLLNKKSGLLGVSGSSGDVRELLAREKTDKHAAEALNLFSYRARKYVGAYAAGLGGLDILVFAGGIGEHSAAMRARICEGLQFLGIDLDPVKNKHDAEIISTVQSGVKVRVIKTDEDRVVAKHMREVLHLAQ